MIAGQSPAPAAEELKRADVAPINSDGTFGHRELTISDAARILRKVVGMEDVWP